MWEGARRACGNGGKWSKDENLERDEFCTTHDTGVGREEEVVVVAGVSRRSRNLGQI